MMDNPSNTRSSDPGIVSDFSKAVELLSSDGGRDEGIRLLRSNCDRGDTDSMVRLGMALMGGTDDEKKESVELFRRAAYNGNASGMRNLAYCYAVGVNVEKDKTKGAELYRKAMEMGSWAAATNLGVMYDYGNGVPQDRDEAFRLYTLAAEHGSIRGMTNLGEFYHYGKGTPVDLDKAEMWYKKAGTPRALHRLALLYLDSPEKLDREKGMDALKRSADGGYGRAMVRYGDEIGGEEAVKYYTSAASKGNQDAAERLRGLGLPVPESSRRR